MTLTTKLVLAFVFVTVAPFTLLVVALSQPAVRQSEELVGVRLQDNIAHAAEGIDQFMINCIRDVKFFTSDLDYISPDVRTNNKRLAEMTYYYPYFSRIMFVAPDGRVAASSYAHEVGKSIHDLFEHGDDIFEQALHAAPGGVYLSDLSDVSEKLEAMAKQGGIAGVALDLQLFAPVYDTGGQCLGVLVTDLVTSHLSDLLNDVQRRLPGNDPVELLDPRGRVLMSTSLETKLLAPHPDAESVLQPLFATSDRGHLVYENSQNKRVMAGYVTLWEYGENKAGNWRLVATAPYDLIMQPAASALSKAGVILLATVMAAAGCGVLLARLLAKPIVGLTQTAKSIAAGRFEARVPVTGNDETGALASAFNAMAETIQSQLEALNDARRQLERRVEERTHELQQEIGERRRSEEALLESNRRFEIVTKATTDVIWDWDLVDDSVWWNKNYETVFGYTQCNSSTSANSWITRIHPEDAPSVMKSLSALLEGDEQVWSGEYRYRRADGSFCFVFDRGCLIRDSEKKPIRMIGAMQDISQRKCAEAELQAAHVQLLETSRRSGMAEVATSVLHNVGNVLNSVNVSCSVISEKVRKSRIDTVTKTADLLNRHQEDLPGFFAKDPAGKALPGFLHKLSVRLLAERASVLDELQLLGQNLEHIKNIITVQQSHAQAGGVCETLPMNELMEEVLRMNAESLARHRIEVVRQYRGAPAISVEKHKVLQILINLINNAQHALNGSGQAKKRIVVGIENGGGQIAVSVKDNGIGIPVQNLTRIFSHGFTTRKDGHGFGLHSGVLAAREMGGQLTVESDGPGCGATFTLLLPIKQQGRKAGASANPNSL